LYCALAIAIQQMETDNEVDLQQIIRRIRHARPQVIPNMVRLFYLTTTTLSEYYVVIQNYM